VPPETTPPASAQAKPRAAIGTWLGVPAAVIVMALIGWFLTTKYSGGSKTSGAGKAAPAPARTQTESRPTLPTPNGNLVSTEYSPNGDIRVEHRSGGWLYLFSAKDESKRFSLRQTSEEAAYVLFSPDEKWLVINERGHLNDASARLYRRVRPDDVEFAEANSNDTPGESLADGGWRFYLKEVNLPESTAREQVRLSGIEWSRDSTGVKLRFDSFGPNGQKIVPVPYVCNYMVSENRFVSETDVAALRGMVKEPVTASSSMPPIFNEASSSSSWEKTINDFVISFVQVNQSPDTNGIVDCYAPAVAYFDQGKVDQNVIRTDVQNYNERWPIRHDDIENGSIGTREISPQADYVATFNQNFLVESPTRRECVRGKMAVTMHVTLEGGHPKITAIQQKNLQRDKGVLEVGTTGFVEVWQTGKQHAAHTAVQTKAQEAPAKNGEMDPAAAQILGRFFPGMVPGGAPAFSNPAAGHGGGGRARVRAAEVKKTKPKKQNHP
jgi:hypothetical protein